MKAKLVLGLLVITALILVISTACGGTTSSLATTSVAPPPVTTVAPPPASTTPPSPPASTTAPAQVIKLKYASPFQIAEAPTAGAYIFMDYIEKNSNGRVKFDRFPGAQLGTAPEMLKLLSTNAVDMATMIHNMFPQQLPLNVGLTNNFQNSSRFAVETGNKFQFNVPETSKILTDEWTANNIRFFTYTASGELALLTKKPINSIDDLKGLKISVPSNIRIGPWTKLGLVPTVINTTDVYEAITRGQVDAIDQTLGAMSTLKWYESGKYVYPYKLYPASAPILFNLKTWNTLPPDIQKIFQDAAIATANATVATAEGDDAKYLKTFTDNGLTIGKFSQANLDAIYTNFMTQWEADAMTNAGKTNKTAEMTGIWAAVHKELGK